MGQSLQRIQRDLVRAQAGRRLFHLGLAAGYAVVDACFPLVGCPADRHAPRFGDFDRGGLYTCRNTDPVGEDFPEGWKGFCQ